MPEVGIKETIAILVCDIFIRVHIVTCISPFINGLTLWMWLVHVDSVWICNNCFSSPVSLTKTAELDIYLFIHMILLISNLDKLLTLVFMFLGVIARHPSYVPYLRQALTPEAVHRYMEHVFEDKSASVNDLVKRYY